MSDRVKKKSALKLSNNSLFGGLKCNGKFGYIFCLFLDNFNKFLCIISVLNLNDGNVPKFHVWNIPNFEVGNVPNLKLGNCIQSIITPPGILKSCCIMVYHCTHVAFIFIWIS